MLPGWVTVEAGDKFLTALLWSEHGAERRVRGWTGGARRCCVTRVMLFVGTPSREGDGDLKGRRQEVTQHTHTFLTDECRVMWSEWEHQLNVCVVPTQGRE